MTHRLFVHAALVAVLAWAAAPACAADRPALVETPMFADAVAGDTLPAVAQRVPDAPRIVSFDGTDVSPGRHGGELRILMGRVKDVRMMVVYGYARLVGYGRDLELRPDLLER
ncbi:MAG: ABC transporter substrate-binding protein, partial [Rhodospirillales bacterium]|nr:ABC transporter substrate-binding protein [Rhodospirillales bacterium]